MLRIERKGKVMTRRINGQPGRGWGRFTLVELLVVVAVVMILAALLLPLLKKAQGMANASSCSNRQRQLGFMFLTFESDRRHLPFASWSTPRFSYANMLVGSDQDKLMGSTYCPTTWNAVNYAGNDLSIFWCTEVPRAASMINQKAGQALTGQYFRIDGPEADQKALLPKVKMTTYRRHSGNAFLACSTGLSHADHFRAYADESDSTACIAARHPGVRTNFVYLDGHGRTAVPALDSSDRLDASRKTMERIGYVNWR